MHQFAGVLQSARRFGFLQSRQHFADPAQFTHVLRAHSQRHPLRGAEQIPQHRNVVARGVFEKHRRTAPPNQGIADHGHFQSRRNRLCAPTQEGLCFELGQEIAQIAVFHIT
ncbi:hypothetical protein GALL_486280 [mine drainage metagenome]|uniref:Uncharacterized protein n=1 Tax=mine drainage metagenome TaxID=410659 RepID=A0A1J5PG61_9ZZZZ